MIDERDLRIDSYNDAIRNSDFTVRVIHSPTGIARSASHKSKWLARKEAIKQIEQALEQGKG